VIIISNTKLVNTVDIHNNFRVNAVSTKIGFN